MKYGARSSNTYKKIISQDNDDSNISDHNIAADFTTPRRSQLSSRSDPTIVRWSRDGDMGGGDESIPYVDNQTNEEYDNTIRTDQYQEHITRTSDDPIIMEVNSEIHIAHVIRIHHKHVRRTYIHQTIMDES